MALTIGQELDWRYDGTNWNEYFLRPLMPLVPNVVGTAVGGMDNTGSSFSITPPAGAVDYLAFVCGTTALVPPTNWFQHYLEAGSNFDAIYRCPASGSPGSNWGGAGNDGIAVVIVGYDQIIGMIATITEFTDTSPAATAPAGGALIARVHSGTGDHTGTMTVGYPSSATLSRQQKIQFQTSSGSYRAASVAHEVAAAGSVASAAWTPAHGSGDYAATLVLTALQKV